MKIFNSLNVIFAFSDVDAPQDLAASNIQTENAMLSWKPPRADITGYILSFEAADGTIRVSKDSRVPLNQEDSRSVKCIQE